MYITWTDLQQTTKGKSIVFNSESNGFGELQATLEVKDQIKVQYCSDAVYVPVTNYSLYDCCEGQVCTVRGCCDASRIRWYASDLTIQELIEMMQCRPEEIFHAIVQARGTSDIYGDFSVGYKFKKIQFTEMPQSADKVEVKIQ